MKVILNGIVTTLSDPTPLSMATFLASLGIKPEDRGIAVAKNSNVIERSHWNTCLINNNDTIDIIHAMHGG
jgi:thiamine biosynthesis protein ThiS